MAEFLNKQMEFIKKYYFVITGLVVFIIYLFTLAPSVVQIDSGELATVQATLGIAHPTGYPLYTIVGYLFSLIPLPFTKIYQLNLLAALYCSAGVSVFVYTSKFVLDNLTSFSFAKAPDIKFSKNKKKNKKEKKKNSQIAFSLDEIIKKILSIAGGLILAFSETFWMQSTSVEVYSLHILLINIIILFLLKAYLYKPDEKRQSDLKAWLIFSAVLALGFTNHMTTLLIVPGVAYLFFTKNRFNADSIKKILLMLLIFFPVLILIYSYLPIRASQNPLLNWGNPTDLERIIRHISGKQYQVWLFASVESAKKQLVHFIDTLSGEFYIELFLSIIGLFTSLNYARKFFAFLLITFLFTILYSINYDINDIDSYFILAYICLSFFAIFGFLKLFQISKKNLKVLISVLALVILIEFYFNFNKVNQSNVYTYEDYTHAILNSVPQGSIIFSYQWDYFVSASYYFRYVENYRNDVVVVDKEILRRSWYYDELNNDYPFLFKNMQEDVNNFKEALIPFERGEKDYNANLLETLYRKIMTDLVATNVIDRSFYIAPELYENEMQRGEFLLPKGYTLVPDLLLFKVVKGNEYVPTKNLDFKIRFGKEKNYYINIIERFVGTMLARRAMYELQFGKTERAKIYAEKIRDDLPGFSMPNVIKNLLLDN